ncbi:MAG: hypothetical protein LBR06_07975 [Bacteroidales bacterium]|jgi:hypothetical protein|nr:hypothetical protein [Bacteroidales bacterium]
MKREFLLFLVCLAVTSCADEKEMLDATGDAYVLVNSDAKGELRYALGLHVRSNVAVSKVSASGPSGVYSLNRESDFDFYYETKFNTQPPVAGEFRFDISLKDGRIHVANDTLTDDSIVPVTITNCQFRAPELIVIWDLVTADKYQVQLATEAGNIVYSSALLEKTTKRLAIPTSVWDTAINGTRGTAIVAALKLTDPIANTLQAKAISSTAVTFPD